MKGFPKEKHMKIRRIRENDTENFFQMMCRLDEETEYMMYEPGERQRTTKNPRVFDSRGFLLLGVIDVEDDGEVTAIDAGS